MRETEDRPASSGPPHATIIPMFSCTSLGRTLQHYRALGFGVTYEQMEPYQYAATQWGSAELHFHGVKKIDPDQASSCLVMIDDLSGTYRTIAAALRQAHRGLPVSGLPRITRLREGHTRFTVYDCDGNSLQFIAVDEPEYDYDSNASEDDSTFGRTLTGISRTQSSLMRALEAAVFLRDTYHDDRAAARKLDHALSRADHPPPVELARALAARAELALALGDTQRANALRGELANVPLDDGERLRFADELQAADRLERLLRPAE